MKANWWYALAVLAWTALLGGVLPAQQPGGIVGTVRVRSGDSVAGAAVALKHQQSGKLYSAQRSLTS